MASLAEKDAEIDRLHAEVERLQSERWAEPYLESLAGDEPFDWDKEILEMKC